MTLRQQLALLRVKERSARSALGSARGVDEKNRLMTLVEEMKVRREGLELKMGVPVGAVVTP